MRVTLSIPDALARKFQSAVPQRQRSRLVTSLLEGELRRREGDLAQACVAANGDKALEKEIDDWQAFEDNIEE
jgi:metal-responsive CopG/Arc/MetJ family transcriptional regulator